MGSGGIEPQDVNFGTGLIWVVSCCFFLGRKITCYTLRWMLDEL